MNCDQIEILLSLNRPGEITPEEERILDAHVQTCPDCARRRASAIRTDDAIRQVRATPLPPTDVEHAVSVILAEIQASERQTQERLRPLWTRVFDVTELPFFRFAAGLAAILIVGTFAIQQLRILHEVSHLQEQLARDQTPALSLEARYVFSPPFTSLTPEVRHMIDMMKRHIWLDPTGRITAPVSTALEFRSAMEARLPGTAGGTIRPLVRRMLYMRSDRIEVTGTEVFVHVPWKGEFQ